jgi:hypothetical protein
MQRKLIAAAILISTALTAPALAQSPGSSSSSQSSLGIPLKADAPLTQEEIEKRKANDRAYQAAIQKIPDKKASDPWGTIRPTAPTWKNKQQQQ